MNHFNHNVVIKEVGQGMGKESLRELLKLPLTAIEFGGFGGTNFAKVELERREDKFTEYFDPLSYIGHTAEEMTFLVNSILKEDQGIQTENLIISGGIRNFLDGYYLINNSQMPAIYGMASTFLKYAKEEYESLKEFTTGQIEGLKMAYRYLKVI
jgi:isopentenyl-diphosphate delta-isomerase